KSWQIIFASQSLTPDEVYRQKPSHACSINSFKYNRAQNPAQKARGWGWLLSNTLSSCTGAWYMLRTMPEEAAGFPSPCHAEFCVIIAAHKQRLPITQFEIQEEAK